MTCWASVSSVPECGGSPSSALARTASCAAKHSSTSKRLAGTRSAREGSSRRWLARPMRWTMRDEPLGADSWMTRSTSPQSMPRSSVEVQTTARSPPRPMAASTLRRCSAAMEPWCSAMGRPSSLISHSFWKANSACQRVLTKTSEVLLAWICL